MAAVETYLEDHFADPITSRTLSDQFGLVPAYLAKLFKEHRGVSPSKYLINLRIEKARELMQSQPGLQVKEISSLVGFGDSLYFSRVFKKETGIWPTEYLNSHHS